MKIKQILNRLAPLLTIGAILLFWEVASRAFSIPDFLLPSPSSILRASRAFTPGEWGQHIGSTLEVALLGYFASVAISLPLAVVLALSPVLSRTIYPILVVIHSTPILAIAPIIVVVLGAGVMPRVAIACIITFFPIVISTATGILSVPAELVELSRSLRGTLLRQILQIRLPYAVPYIFSGLKVSITLAVVGAVVAEFVAAEQGLGYLILFCTSNFKIPLAFAALVVLIGMSLTLFQLVLFCQRLFFPWSIPKIAS